MTEYYEALTGAVANLKSGDRVARHAFFDRARRLVLERLQSTDPPMAAADIRAEMNAFDAAVLRIEKDLLPPPAQPAPRQAPPVPVRGRAAPAPPPHAPPRQRPISPQHHDELAIPPEDVGAAPDDEAPLEESAAAPAAHRRQRSKTVMFIGVAAIVAVVAALGYALLPRGEQRARPPAPVPAPAAPAPQASRAPVGLVTPPPPVRKVEDTASNADNLPYILRRQLVYYRTVQQPGTVVISKSQHFIYVVRPNSAAMRYTFSMGPDCADLAGLYIVTRSGDAPQADTADGRAMILGDTKCRIRQMDPAGTLGQNLRTPGFQLAKEDFADFFDHTDKDARIVVTN